MSIRRTRHLWTRGVHSIAGSAVLVAIVLTAAPRAVTTEFNVGRKLQAARESPVPADDALRDITLITRGASETPLVLLAAIIRRDVVVALEESQAFMIRIRTGRSTLFEYWPIEWKVSGYLPGKYRLAEDQFGPGDEFIVGDRFISGDQFPRLGEDADGFLRQAGVKSGGRDMLILFAVPADERLRASASAKPLFLGFIPGIVCGSGC